MEARPTSMYRVPWQSAHAERARPPVRRPQPSVARPHRALPDRGLPDRGQPDEGQPDRDLRAGTPDMRWPSLTRQAPRRIPVVGPTEALRRPGGPGVDAPRGAAPGLPDHEQESGWQLAQRAWQDSGVDWERDAPEPDYRLPDPYAAQQYSAAYPGGSYPPGAYPPDAYPADYYGDDADAAGAADSYLHDDLSPAQQYSPAPYPAAGPLTDRHPTRPDLPVLRDPAEFLQGVGLWPVQQPAEAADDRDLAPRDDDEPGLAGEDDRNAGDGWDQQPADRAADDPAPVREAAVPEAPPLPRRIRQAGAGWNEQPRGGLTARYAFAPASPFAPSPAFASPRSLGAPPEPHATRPFSSAPLSAPVAPAAPPLGESDELFRAWQGSVREAVGDRTPWSPRSRPARRRGSRGLGWQVAKVGVPAAVIVTVGAGALLMLTGRANNMLAERASSGPLPSGQPRTAAASGQPGAGQPGAGLTLAGYPGQHGPVGVAAMWSAGGTTMAVGYADAHPAVWRHAANGSWSLVSAAALGGLTGHLTSVAQETSGWIAVGSVNEHGTAGPAVFGSPDGVTWTPLPALTGIAGGDAQFLGVAAGPGGYLVVGKQGSGGAERASFWWSADLKNWVGGSAMGAPSNAAAAAAVNDGFIAVGSMAGCHAIWVSSDGQHWAEHDLAKPTGATSAALNSVAVDQSGRFVAAGVATGGAGDIPMVIASADGGAHLTQVVLSAPQGPASVTAVTATSGGFVAVGLAGPAQAQRAVEWTSRDGFTWSAAALVPSAGTSQVTALTGNGGTVTGTAQRSAGPSVLAIPAR